MSPQRVIRPAARRTPAGARSLLWTAAAAALPVIVTVLVLVAVSLALLLFTARGFDSLFAVVAVEWLVVNRVPLAVDDLMLGFLPLLPPLLYVALLARQTRLVLADIEQPGPREAGAAITGVTLAGVLLTVFAALVVGSANSDFAVRQESLPQALVWTVVVAVVGSGLGVWLYFRHQLREALPLWVRGGLHLGVAFAAALWAIASALVLVGLLVAWGPVTELVLIGKGFVGMAALVVISMAYLPNVVAATATLLVGGEAHLGQASYSVFSVSRGPMPDVPLAAMLPTTNPHWMVQGLLLVTVLTAAVLSRSVAHWFRNTADAVKATCLAAVVVAALIVLTPVVAGGSLGALGMVGTGSFIAGGTALLLFGVIGSATIALSLAGLTRRRERAENELARRRKHAGTAVPVAEPEFGSEFETEPEPEREEESEAEPEAESEPEEELRSESWADDEVEDDDDESDSDAQGETSAEIPDEASAETLDSKDSGSDSDSGSSPKSGSVSAPGSDTDADPDSDADSDPESGSGSGAVGDRVRGIEADD